MREPHVEADLLVVASGSGSLSETLLLGSTAQRVQHSAPCPAETGLDTSTVEEP